MLDPDWAPQAMLSDKCNQLIESPPLICLKKILVCVARLDGSHLVSTLPVQTGLQKAPKCQTLSSEGLVRTRTNAAPK